MPTEERVTLENVSDVRQSIMFNPDDEDEAAELREYALPEYAVLDFEPAVARAFLLRRGKYVRPYEPVQLPPPEPGEPVVYLANMTGSPFHEPEVTVTLFERGKQVDRTMPNPLRTPQTLSHVMMGGEVIQPCRHDPTSKESINLPPTIIKLPPFRRYKMGMTLADWLIKRDLAQIPGLSGAVAIVSEPRQYEPQRHWGLVRMQAYAGRVDPDRFSEKDPQFGRLMRARTEAFKSDADEREVCVELWQAIWFRLLDERYGAPNQQEHRQIVAVLMANRGIKPPKKGAKAS